MLGLAKAATLKQGGGSASGQAYRYLRAYFDLSASGYDEAYLREIEYIDSSSTSYPTQVMTNNAAPAPLVASGNTGGNYYRLFDKSTTVNAVGGTGTWNTRFIQLDLGVEEFVAAGGHIKVFANLPGGTLELRKVEASNSGSFSGEEQVLFDGTKSLVSGDNTQNFA